MYHVVGDLVLHPAPLDLLVLEDLYGDQVREAALDVVHDEVRGREAALDERSQRHHDSLARGEGLPDRAGRREGFGYLVEESGPAALLGLGDLEDGAADVVREVLRELSCAQRHYSWPSL